MEEGIVKCPSTNNQSKPYETWEENFERSLVFFKALKDAGIAGVRAFLQDPVAMKQKALAPPVRAAFLKEWESVIAATLPGDSAIDNSLENFFGITRTGNSEAVIESILGEINALLSVFFAEGKLVPAHNCQKRGNPFQTVFERTISAVKQGERVRQYFYEEERNKSICEFPVVATSFVRPTGDVLEKLCITLCPDLQTEFGARELGKNEIVTAKLGETLYIQFKEWPFDPKKKTSVRVPAMNLGRSLLLGDALAAKNIRDIHPRLLYFMWLTSYDFFKKFFGGRHDCGSFRFVPPLKGRENVLLKDARAAPIPTDERAFFERHNGPLRVKYEGQHPNFIMYAAYGKITDVTKLEQRSEVKYRVPLTEADALQRNREMHAWYFALSYLVTRKTSYIASDFYESYLNKKLIVWFQLYEKKPDVFQRAQSFVEWAVGKPPQFVTLQNVLPLLAYLSAEGWQGPSGTEIRLRGGRRSSSKNTLKGKKRTRKALKRKNRH